MASSNTDLVVYGDWEIDHLEKDKNGNITKVIWQYWSEKTYKGNGYYYAKAGETYFDADDTAPDYINYYDLKKEDVLRWIHEELGAEKVSEIENYVTTFVNNIDPVEEGDDLEELDWMSPPSANTN